MDNRNEPGAARAAWQDLVEALATADDSFLTTARGTFDDYEIATGYRNLTHILSFATGMYMNADPNWPEFVMSWKDPPGEKTLGEHPDVHYRWASVEGGRRYRITGRRGDEAYLSFTLHRGVRGSGMDQFFDSHLNQHDLTTDADGNFEIIVSPEPEGENWMRSSEDANEIYARAYHFDLKHERLATYRIEPLDAPPPQRLTSDAVAARLGQMTRLVRDMTRAFPQPLDDPNVVGDLWQTDPDGPSRMWSALDNVYSRGVFRLPESHVLLVEGIVVPCDYWGIQLWTPFLGSGDHRHTRVTINTNQARLGPNGEFKVAVATEDPQVPGLDWISSAGGTQGTFFIRWMCPRRATRHTNVPARVGRVASAIGRMITHGVDDRVVVITGAGRGIGRGIARHLGRNGATIVVAEHRAHRLEDVMAELEVLGVTSLGVECDVGSRDSVFAMVDAAMSMFGRVDGIVNNAVSLVAAKPIEDVTQHDMDVLHRTGTNATLWGMQAVFPHMRAQGWGRIVNVGSAAGIRGSAGTAPYNAAKEAIRALTRTAAREWARHGIVVNCFCPASAGHHQAPPVGNIHREAWEAMYAMHPMDRDGDAEDDIAPAVLFLLSDACRFMTGETLMLDGGGQMRA